MHTAAKRRRLNFGLGYAGGTSALLVGIWLAVRCWTFQNSTGVPDEHVRDTCVEISAALFVLLALSQFTLLVIAALRRYWEVSIAAGAVLLALAGFVLTFPWRVH